MLPPIPEQSTPSPNPLLIDLIRHQMNAMGGSISFSQYMAQALYADNLGYYCTKQPFGPTGDFVTAPELSPLFARCMAATCKQIGGDIVEYGGGSGVFARDLLTALAEQDALPNHYWIIETSKRLRAEQAALLETACPQWFSRIHWADAPPDKRSGVIIANELLDALPFDCFQFQAGHFFERRVSWSNDQFNWVLQPVSPHLSAELSKLPPLPEGYCFEIRQGLADFVKTMASKLQKGLLLLIDYGYGRTEFLHPARLNGTLTCFYQHRHHSNPLILCGLQDITAHVDFTTVAEAATDAGLSLIGFSTQAAFLLGAGLTTLAAPHPTDSAKTQWQQAQIIKKLTFPDEMGEVIKVIGFSPDPTLTLPGFLLKDCRHDL